MPAPLAITPPSTIPLLGRGALAPASQPAPQPASQSQSQTAAGTGSSLAFSLPDAATAQPAAVATGTPAAQPLRYHRVTVAEATLYPEPLPSFSAASEAAGSKTTPQAHGIERFLWGKQGFSFNSLLQSLNPLEHIPVVSSVYRHFTGDLIGAVASTIGGGLIGGPIGAAASLASSAFEAITGDDIGGHIMTALLGSAKPDTDNPDTGKPDTGKPPAAGADLAVASATPMLASAQAPLPPGALELTNLPWLSGAAASASGAGSSAAANSASDDQLLAGIAAPTRGGATMPGAAPASNADSRPLAPSDFAQRMMEALDKYQAAAKLHEAPAALAVDVGG